MFAALAGMGGGVSSSTSGGTAGPATNSGVNVTGSVGSLTALQQLVALTNGPSSTGGVPWSQQSYSAPVEYNPNKAPATLTWLLIGSAFVLLILLMKR